MRAWRWIRMPSLQTRVADIAREFATAEHQGGRERRQGARALARGAHQPRIVRRAEHHGGCRHQVQAEVLQELRR